MFEMFLMEVELGGVKRAGVGPSLADGWKRLRDHNTHLLSRVSRLEQENNDLDQKRRGLKTVITALVRQIHELETRLAIARSLYPQTNGTVAQFMGGRLTTLKEVTQ